VPIRWGERKKKEMKKRKWLLKEKSESKSKGYSARFLFSFEGVLPCEKKLNLR
jgi:hypothetical protein